MFGEHIPTLCVKCSFGLAKYLSSKSETMTTACGTPGYVAPEILKNEPYGPAVDMWSIGVILYILLCGFPPFYDESAAVMHSDDRPTFRCWFSLLPSIFVQVLYAQIKRGDYDFPDPYWTDISADAKDLVTRLLTVDPEKRCTCDELLVHPWIAGDKASDKKFGSHHQKRLREFNARRKLRKGINMIIAVNKLTRGMDINFGDTKQVKEAYDAVKKVHD